MYPSLLKTSLGPSVCYRADCSQFKNVQSYFLSKLLGNIFKILITISKAITFDSINCSTIFAVQYLNLIGSVFSSRNHFVPFSHIEATAVYMINY